MDELYDELAAKLDRLYMKRILKVREWRSTDLVYIFVVVV
jgi:hypothetical protein